MKLTLHSFKKAAKRHAAHTGKPLSTAQEELALTLGFPNFHSVIQRLSPHASGASSSPLQPLPGAPPAPPKNKNNGEKSAAFWITSAVVLACLAVLPTFLTTGSETIWGSSGSPEPLGSSRSASHSPAAPQEPQSFKRGVELTIRPRLPIEEARRSMIDACLAPCKTVSEQGDTTRARAEFLVPLSGQGPFLLSMEALGDITQRSHATEAISQGPLGADHRANLLAYRDKLRKMLSEPSTPDALIKIHQQLEQTQSQLDEATATVSTLQSQGAMVRFQVVLHNDLPLNVLSESLSQAQPHFISGLSMLLAALAFGSPLLLAAGAMALGIAAYRWAFRRQGSHPARSSEAKPIDAPDGPNGPKDH
jgi:hypothetical protein